MDLATRRRLARQSVRQTRPNQVPNWLQPIPVPANARGQAAYHPYDCMTLLCLCPFFNVSHSNQVQNEVHVQKTNDSVGQIL